VLNGTEKMLDRIKLTARAILTGKPMPYAGLDLLNRVLVASGRSAESVATWNSWLEELRGDSAMADAYELAKPVIATGRVSAASMPNWSDRLKAYPAPIEVFYIMMRALKPKEIIETGVGFGRTTSLLLAALRHNGSGRLLSIDLPNRGRFHIGDSETGILVPKDYRDRWELVVADAVYELPRRMQGSKLDVFIHDSRHTYSHMAYEYCLAEMHLPHNGIIISDDILENSAFRDIMRGLNYPTFSHLKNHGLGISVVRHN
jgi:predicted O-methyltransferase YrrM